MAGLVLKDAKEKTEQSEARSNKLTRRPLRANDMPAEAISAVTVLKAGCYEAENRE